MLHNANMQSVSVDIAYPRTLEIKYAVDYDPSVQYSFSGSIKIGSYEDGVSFSFTSYSYIASVEFSQLVLEDILKNGNVVVITEGIITRSKDGRNIEEDVQDSIVFRFKPTFSGTIRHFQYEMIDWIEVIVCGYVASPFTGYNGNITLMYNTYVDVTHTEAFGECEEGLNKLNEGNVQSKLHSELVSYTSASIQKDASTGVGFILYARMTYPTISPPLEIVITDIVIIFDGGADFEFTNETCTLTELD